MATGPEQRHVSEIPPNWPWIEAETTGTTWEDWEDARPIDTTPLSDALSHELAAAKDRALDEETVDA